jgi:hypothetical protein
MMWTLPKALRFATEDSANTDPYSPENQIDDGSSTDPSDPSGGIASGTLFGGLNSATSASASPAVSPSIPREGAPFVALSSATSGSATSTGAAAVGPAAAQVNSIVSTPGSGLVFNNTWGSITPAGDATEFENCVVAAEKQLQSVFTNNVTLNITFNLGPTPNNDHDFSQTSSINYSYATLKVAMLKAAPNDVLPSYDPSGGKGFNIPEAYARMLGLTSAAPANDATVTIDSNLNWSFGQDVVDAVTHAITESTMGRDSGLGVFNGNIWTAMDLFRYTAPTSPGGSGTYDPNANDTAFFSSNGGELTSQSAGLFFCNQFGPNDPDDWAQPGVFGTVNPGDTFTMVPTEFALMSALGWTSQPQFFTASSGDWENSSNWNNGRAPFPAEDVEIGYYGLVGANATLSNGANVTVDSITLNTHSSLTIEDGATLTATNGSAPNPADATGLAGGNEGTITVQDGFFEIGGTFENSGTLVIGDGSGDGILRLIDNVTLDGGGAVNLGGISVGFSADVVKGPGPNPNPPPPVTFVGAGDITGARDLVNVDQTISGNGEISVAGLDNQANGKIGATIADYGLQIQFGSLLSNEGELFADAQATLFLDPTVAGAGQTATLDNSGHIDLAAGADLEVTDNLTALGHGSIDFNGAGAALTSDGGDVTSFTNQSSIIATASAQIGDVGVKSVDDLTLINSGSIIAEGSGVTLTLATGANTIVGGGGLIEAETGAELTIDSPVKTATTQPILGGPPQPGSGNSPVIQSTIDAASGGVVNINAAIFDGATGSNQVNGRILIDGGTVNVAAGVTIGVPVTFAGAGGSLNLASEPSDVVVNGAGGTISLSNAGANVTGVGFTVTETGVDRLAIGGDGAAGAADVVQGSGETTTTHAASNVTFIGSHDTIDAGLGNDLTLQGADEVLNLRQLFGDMTVNGFSATDTMNFSKLDFADFQALQGHMQQSGANTLITLDAHDAITLTNVALSTLTASQFRFS